MMDYQTDDGYGGYAVPVPGMYEPELSTDTRVEETRDDTNTPRGCEGCEHNQQQMMSAIEYLGLQQEKMVNAFNVIGNQQQQMWDGIGNLMKFMNSIAADLSTMSVMDKVKLARQLMGDKD